MKNFSSYIKSVFVVIALVITVTDVRAQEIYREETNPATVQLRTNGLYDILLCPNIGLEIQTDLGIAFQLDYIGAWWNSDQSHRYFSDYGFQTEMRYYLSSRKQEMPYTGWHGGLYGYLMTYDFEFGGKGYQCADLSRTFSVGISGGYTLPISRKLSLDFTVGIGYFQSRYTEYEPAASWYVATGYKKFSFFGPTKLEASLVWNINKVNVKHKKDLSYE
jgi:hypothetical protein